MKVTLADVKKKFLEGTVKRVVFVCFMIFVSIIAYRLIKILSVVNKISKENLKIKEIRYNTSESLNEVTAVVCVENKYSPLQLNILCISGSVISESLNDEKIIGFSLNDIALNKNQPLDIIARFKFNEIYNGPIIEALSSGNIYITVSFSLRLRFCLVPFYFYVFHKIKIPIDNSTTPSHSPTNKFDMSQLASSLKIDAESKRDKLGFLIQIDQNSIINILKEHVPIVRDIALNIKITDILFKTNLPFMTPLRIKSISSPVVDSSELILAQFDIDTKSSHFRSALHDIIDYGSIDLAILDVVLNKSEIKSEIKGDIRSDIKGDRENGMKSDNKTDSKCDNKNDNKGDNKNDIKTDFKSNHKKGNVVWNDKKNSPVLNLLKKSVKNETENNFLENTKIFFEDIEIDGKIRFKVEVNNDSKIYQMFRNISMLFSNSKIGAFIKSGSTILFEIDAKIADFDKRFFNTFSNKTAILSVSISCKNLKNSISHFMQDKTLHLELFTKSGVFQILNDFIILYNTMGVCAYGYYDDYRFLSDDDEYYIGKKKSFDHVFEDRRSLSKLNITHSVMSNDFSNKIMVESEVLLSKSIPKDSYISMNIPDIKVNVYSGALQGNIKVNGKKMFVSLEDSLDVISRIRGQLKIVSEFGFKERITPSVTEDLFNFTKNGHFEIEGLDNTGVYFRDILEPELLDSEGDGAEYSYESKQNIGERYSEENKQNIGERYAKENAEENKQNIGESNERKKTEKNRRENKSDDEKVKSLFISKIKVNVNQTDKIEHFKIIFKNKEFHGKKMNFKDDLYEKNKRPAILQNFLAKCPDEVDEDLSEIYTEINSRIAVLFNEINSLRLPCINNIINIEDIGLSVSKVLADGTETSLVKVIVPSPVFNVTVVNGQCYVYLDDNISTSVIFCDAMALLDTKGKLVFKDCAVDSRANVLSKIVAAVLGRDASGDERVLKTDSSISVKSAARGKKIGDNHEEYLLYLKVFGKKELLDFGDLIELENMHNFGLEIYFNGSEKELTEGKASNNKISENKVNESKSIDENIIGTKVNESKSIDENKPTEGKTSESKPSENKSHSDKSNESKLIDNKLTENKFTRNRFTDNRFTDDNSVKIQVNRGENSGMRFIEFRLRLSVDTTRHISAMNVSTKMDCGLTVTEKFSASKTKAYFEKIIHWDFYNSKRSGKSMTLTKKLRKYFENQSFIRLEVCNIKNSENNSLNSVMIISCRDLTKDIPVVIRGIFEKLPLKIRPASFKFELSAKVNDCVAFRYRKSKKNAFSLNYIDIKISQSYSFREPEILHHVALSPDSKDEPDPILNEKSALIRLNWDLSVNDLTFLRKLSAIGKNMEMEIFSMRVFEAFEFGLGPEELQKAVSLRIFDNSMGCIDLHLPFRICIINSAVSFLFVCDNNISFLCRLAGDISDPKLRNHGFTISLPFKLLTDSDLSVANRIDPGITKNSFTVKYSENEVLVRLNTVIDIDPILYILLRIHYSSSIFRMVPTFEKACNLFVSEDFKLFEKLFYDFMWDVPIANRVFYDYDFSYPSSRIQRSTIRTVDDAFDPPENMPQTFYLDLSFVVIEGIHLVMRRFKFFGHLGTFRKSIMYLLFG